MPRDPRYDILFEPVRIGPKTARNRFYQVPHCNGMGHLHPAAVAAMRGVKAEGGWAVVATEEVELHHSSDIFPAIEGRLWDDRDIPALARMVEAVHAHGALAAIELVHNGHHSINGYSREPTPGVSTRPLENRIPAHTYAMDKDDIRRYRRWHRDAVLRAERCGFDLIYVYCGHDLTMPSCFLSRRYNDRIDEYGGSLENRVRLLRETLEDTLEAVGDRCGVPLRFAVEELLGTDGLSCDNEGRDVVEMLAELPHLWDVNLADWANDSQTSRFAEAGYQEPFIAFVKQVTSKPVVGVGRYTAPDRMVALIRGGVIDMIGAARPSIADPFLPKKIEDGRIEDIRECIGCNVCVSHDFLATPIRCTQNPTMGEEWRRGWHPERVAARGSDARVLVVGAGPAGLEAARILGARGYETMLAEATTQLGGRVARERRLPGLSEWGRVQDYREYQIRQMAAVDIYCDSRLTAAEVLAVGARHVAVATGAAWRRDGVGRSARHPVPGAAGAAVYTPDDVMAGTAIAGPVVVYDDDHDYMGGVIAGKLCRDGARVTLVTPAADVSTLTHRTLEQHRIQKGLLEIGVTIVPLHRLVAITADSVRVGCVYTGRPRTIAAAATVLVTAMLPDRTLWDGLQAVRGDWADAGLVSAVRIGDALAPSTIAAAVWSGHRFAREIDADPGDGVPFRRDIVAVSSGA